MDYLRRYPAREAFTRTVVNLMASNGLEAPAYPRVQVLPPKTKDRRWTTLTFPTNTVIASQAWMPAISVPAGFTPGGIPVGLELVGKPYDEPTLLRFAYAFEQATRHRRPPAAEERTAGGGRIRTLTDACLNSSGSPPRGTGALSWSPPGAGA